MGNLLRKVALQDKLKWTFFSATPTSPSAKIAYGQAKYTTRDSEEKLTDKSRCTQTLPVVPGAILPARKLNERESLGDGWLHLRAPPAKVAKGEVAEADRRGTAR